MPCGILIWNGNQENLTPVGTRLEALTSDSKEPGIPVRVERKRNVARSRPKTKRTAPEMQNFFIMRKQLTLGKMARGSFS